MNQNQEQYELAKMYKEIDLKTADSGTLIITMYEETITFLEQAVALLEKEKHKSFDTVNNLLTKSQALITELMLSLNKNASSSLYDNLYNLYLYFNQELREANFTKDSKRIIPIIHCLKELLEAWKEVVRTTSKTMPNTRKGLNISL